LYRTVHCLQDSGGEGQTKPIRECSSLEWSQDTSQKYHTLERNTSVLPADRFIMEAERRLVFGDFSYEYLLIDLDMPRWTDETCSQCVGPVPEIEVDGKIYNFRWTAVIDDDI